MLTEKEIGYFALTHIVATWSEDPRKQVGAVIVSGQQMITGYNCLPTGIKRGEENCRLNVRELKLKYIEHAERNAIYAAANSGFKLKDSTMYCNWFPCSDCAKGIIQSGIKTLVTTKPDENSRWYAEMIIAETMFKEANVELKYIEEEDAKSGFNFKNNS